LKITSKHFRKGTLTNSITSLYRDPIGFYKKKRKGGRKGVGGE
jgi:hypothetical protein